MRKTSKMDLNFTPIKTQEIDLVLRLLKSAAARIAKMNIDHWHYWANPPLEKIRWVEKGLAQNEFYAIKNAEKIRVGMVRIATEDLLYWGPQADRAYYIHSLVVEDPFVGQAMGKRILQQIEKNASLAGCSYLRLDADAKNQKLCHYYEAQGFTPVAIKHLAHTQYQLYQKQLNKSAVL